MKVKWLTCKTAVTNVASEGNRDAEEASDGRILS